MTMRRVFLAVLVALMALTIYWALPGRIETTRYATLADARADRLFERGWLPDLLPPSTHDLRVMHRIDLANSTGDFRFEPTEFAAFSARLAAYTKKKSPFTGFADQVEAHIKQGFPALQHVAEGNTWVFLCKPEQGASSYAMWLSR